MVKYCLLEEKKNAMDTRQKRLDFLIELIDELGGE